MKLLCLPVLVLVLSGCSADKSMYKAYVSISRSNNSVETEKLKQDGKTARTAILVQQGIKINKTKKIKPKKQKNKFWQKANIQKYRGNGFSIMSISNGPPCSVICADGCSDECSRKCPGLCDEDGIYDKLENLNTNDLESSEEFEYNPEYIESSQPSIQIIGATGTVTINLGAGASTLGNTEQKKEKQVILPKSTTQVMAEKGMDLFGSIARVVGWWGLAHEVSSAFKSVAETPTNYVDNNGRSEVFDSRNQSINFTQEEEIGE